MRLAKAAVLLGAIISLSGCSLWPWHKHHPSASQLDLSAAAGSAEAPAAAASISAVAAASAATVAAAPAMEVDSQASTDADGHVDESAYAPFSRADWQQLWSWYGPLAQCTDRYMSSAGINGKLLGLSLVQLHQDEAVIAEARRLLGPDLPPLADNAPLAARAELASQAVWQLMQDQPALNLGQVLARKALARYDLALVAGPACQLDPGYHSLLTKALH